MSTNSVQRVIAGAGHAELIRHEKASVATTQAILDVVSVIRNQTAVTN